MSEERTATQKAYSLMQAIEGQTHRTGLFDDKFERDLSEALYTFKEGLDISIELDNVIMLWQLVEYLAVTKLDDKFKL